MNKIIVLLFLVIACKIGADDIVCTGYSRITTQHQIDTLKNESCNVINGTVYLESRIHSLEGLSNIQKITGDLWLEGLRTTSLHGFGNLTTIGGDLEIYLCDMLISLHGLGNLTTIGGYLSIGRCYDLTVLRGLENLVSCGSLILGYNNKLTSIAPLQNLKVNGVLKISGTAIDCNNLCNVKIMLDLAKNATVENSEDIKCNYQNFVCSREVENCSYDTTCEICNESCDFQIVNRRCGDGEVDPEEECDVTVHQTECQYSQQNCSLCNSNCTLVTQTGSFCGDNILDLGYEQCDNTTDPTCSKNCTIVIKPSSIPEPGTASESSNSKAALTNSGPSLSSHPTQISDSSSEISSSSFTTSEISNSVAALTNGGLSSFDSGKISTGSDSRSKVLASPKSSLPGFTKETFYLNNSTQFLSDFCVLKFCEIKISDSFRVFTIETIDVNQNLIISTRQKLEIMTGNLDLKTYNLTLSVGSKVVVQNGCLDAKNSSLILDFEKLDLTKQKQSKITFIFLQSQFDTSPVNRKLRDPIINYQTDSSEFSKIEIINRPVETCINSGEIYAQNKLAVVVKSVHHCISDSKILHFYQSLFLFSTVLFGII